MAQIADALDNAASVLIVGPSGSGKSTLMWQTAYARQDHHVIVLNHVREDDVPEIACFFQLMAPSDGPPLLVCVDDVHRPGVAGWPALLRRVGSDSKIRLIGTCREEFFQPSLTGPGVATIVRPELDATEAQEIGSQLLQPPDRKPSRQDLNVLHQDARGLMLEFIYLATTSSRLTDVLSEQADRIAHADDSALPDVARVVLAADVCGHGLPLRQLRELHLQDSDIARALNQLSSEHVVIEAEGVVRGLHPVRSRHLLQRLHATLPRLSETLSQLMALLPMDALDDVVATWQLLDARDAELLEDSLARRISSSAEINARTVSELLLRAEASLYAHTLHGVLQDRDEEFAGALLLGKAGSRGRGMQILTAALRETPIGSPLMQSVLPRMERYDQLHRSLPGPRLLRSNVIALLSQETRQLLLAELRVSLRGLEDFSGSEAFTKEQLKTLAQFYSDVADSWDPVLEPSYFLPKKVAVDLPSDLRRWSARLPRTGPD